MLKEGKWARTIQKTEIPEEIKETGHGCEEWAWTRGGRRQRGGRDAGTLPNHSES